MRTGVTVIGGGVWVPVLCEQLARAAEHESVEIKLVARDQARLSIIAADAEARVCALKPGWTVKSLTADHALENTSIVILMLRAGGLAARHIDETFPRSFSVEGDEGLGLGGMANALRSIPVMRRLGRKIAETCPDARVLNLVAPLGLTTRGLIEEGVSALGVCELPIISREAIFDTLGAKCDYIGLNHLGWFWLPEREFSQADIEGLEAAGLAERSVLKNFGAIPLKYHYRLFDHAAGASINVHPPRARGKALSGMSDQILTQMARFPGGPIKALNQRDMPWLQHALTPITVGILDGLGEWTDFVNVPNEGTEPLLPDEVVIETCRTGQTRRSPPPPRVLDTVSGFAEAEIQVWNAHVADNPLPALSAAIDALPFGKGSGPTRAQAQAVLDASRAVDID